MFIYYVRNNNAYFNDLGIKNSYNFNNNQLKNIQQKNIKSKISVAF